jgi:hypothetical protein
MGRHPPGRKAIPRTRRPAPDPQGPPLRRQQVSYVGHVLGGIGSYTAQTKVIDAERTLASERSGRLITIPGIGSVSVTCSARPVAAFRLTRWARGEGPPTVTQTVASTHGLTSLAGLAGSFTVPKAETTRQDAYQWQITDGAARRSSSQPPSPVCSPEPRSDATSSERPPWSPPERSTATRTD